MTTDTTNPSGTSGGTPGNSPGDDGLTDDEYHAALAAFIGRELGPPTPAPDEVNQAMIRHWCEALGDTNPVYVDPEAAVASVHSGIVAPPAMLQAWVMMGINGPQRNSDGPYEQLTDLLAGRGFTSVVATNCEQTYDRYLRPGDRLTMRTTITDVSARKDTALGTGHFVTTRQDYLDAHGEQVGSMVFRIIRFRPRAAAPAPEPQPPVAPRPQPATTPDNQWWFDAIAAGRLVVQKCSDCGAIQHPPGPMCPRCHSLAWQEQPTATTGIVHSFVVVHYPQVPGFEYPLGIVLVDVDTPGDLVRPVRMVMNTTDPDTSALSVGAAVEIEIREVGGVHLPFATLTDQPATPSEGNPS
jgi:uncharacterized OB-fold protein/acyl dehydratase